jgi:ATP-dependent helicase STH1/SNF2
LSEEETLLIIRRLHKVLRPFLLRRLKKDVEKDLPDKVEKVIKCKMSALQSRLYQQLTKHKMLFLGENAQGASSSGLKGLNNQIMQLRKICNHPFVFEEVENIVNPSKTNNDNLWRVAGKFELLDRILPKFRATGHRVLIFFQMTQIMDIMEDFLRLKGLMYLRLDGATKAEDRSDLLKKFNAPDSPYFAFLLSTRAGGLGLNLQSADTVIIYDTDWNPHQDLQAQDRAHRIGQTKEVRILRLITEDSIEENILERAHQKLDIDGKVIQAGKFDNKSTPEEQEAFLRSLLEAEEAKRGHKDDGDDLDDEELNEILARSDDEREAFRQIDLQRSRTASHQSRLFTEAELPEVYKRDIVKEMQAIREAQDQEMYGRGARERREVHYDDGLTEDQWLEAIDDDNDTVEDASARKRQKQAKKILHRGIRRVTSPSDIGSPGTPSSPNLSTRGSTPAAKRKRPTVFKKASKESSVDDGNPSRKRSKGRPPKVKETLSIDDRVELQQRAESIYDYVIRVKDGDRRRIALFVQLPSKRDYPDYYTIITEPMACDTIQKRINNKAYQSIEEFARDFKQMFANARIYNEEGSWVVTDANELEKAFDMKYEELCKTPPPKFVLQNRIMVKYVPGSVNGDDISSAVGLGTLSNAGRPSHVINMDTALEKSIQNIGTSDSGSQVLTKAAEHMHSVNNLLSTPKEQEMDITQAPINGDDDTIDISQTMGAVGDDLDMYTSGMMIDDHELDLSSFHNDDFNFTTE